MRAIQAESNSFLRSVLILLLLATSIALFFWLKGEPRIFRVANPSNVNLMIVLSAMGLGISGKQTPPAMRILLGYITGSLTLYLITGYKLHDLAVGHPVADQLWIAVICAFLSYWRPTLSLIPIIAVMWTKILTRKDFGLSITSTDYMVVVELGVLLCLFLIPASLFQIFATLWRSRRDQLCNFSHSYLNAAILVGAAVHLSNYFYSGYQKLVLENAGLLTWVLENPTYILTAASIDFDYLTIFEIPGMPDWILAAIKWITIPLNAIVLASQLLVVVALFSRRFIIGITIFFDVIHLAIFGLTAIFFWKWIMLNLGIVHAFSMLRRENWQPPLWLSIAALCVLLGAPWVFQVARLGWFDSGGVNYAHWQAQTKDGARVEVPTNFFLDASVTFAQQRPGRPFTGFFPTHDWGTTMDARIMHRFSEACEPEHLPKPAMDPTQLEVLASFIRRHHTRVVSRAGGKGNIAYDWYPHHIWSSPFAYETFQNLDLSQITSYILIVEANCLKVDYTGAIEKRTLAREEINFPL